MLFASGCIVCAAPTGPVCAPCRMRLVAGGRVDIDGLDACRAALRLDDASRQIIAAFKYRGRRQLGTWLGALMEPLVPLAADLITWVPTTQLRRRRRGYDQAQELASSLSRRTGVPAARSLARSGDDVRQTGLARSDRLAGPDLAACAIVAGLVVVVDDVATTGSSLRVASEALRSAGADRVVGLVAAATPRRCHASPSAQLRGQAARGLTRGAARHPARHRMESDGLQKSV